MINVILYVSTVLIWGTTWIAIAAQVVEVSILLSIFYRFTVASIVMLSVLAFIGKLKRPHSWSFVVIQAICLFCLNFIGLYMASSLITSGLVSVVFSLASVFNALNARLFFKDSLSIKTVLSGIVGVIGLTLIFWNDLFISSDISTLKGISWAVLGTMMFSYGNMASRKNSEIGISPVTSNSWGMGIGALSLALMIIVSGQQFIIPIDTKYWVVLVYLALIGSVLAFTVYLTLVARVGSAHAGYATVIFPVVALTISTFFEEYVWTVSSMVGVTFTIVGNILMFWPLRKTRGSEEFGNGVLNKTVQTK